MSDTVELSAPGLFLGDVSLSHPVEADREEVRRAADSSETWTWYTYRADGAHFETFWPRFVDEHCPPDEVHHVVRWRGEVVGATCFLAVDTRHKRVEIGGTWYSAAARGTKVNPACKYLLLQRAFDWGARRVEIKTDSKNARSRAAIEKLGARFEGTLRNHMLLHDGRSRDTVYYSVIPEDWPAIQARLARRLKLD
ncbi:MAG: GNAT family N-acetyltransferase [Hyphomonadaceae bacterium]|nr:GNAT family N-acetyltransferase [Hyphomonadaceae bacterium]